MGERKRLAAYAVAIGGLALALVLPWWKFSAFGASLEISLRTVEVCGLGSCREVGMPDKGSFPAVASITWWVILVDVVVIAGLGIATVAGAQVDKLVKPAAVLSGAVGALVGLCFLTLDAPGLGDAIVGIRLGLIGALVGAGAGWAGGWIEDEPRAPIETALLAARRAEPAPATPSAPAPKANLDYQRVIDQASRSGPGKGVASRPAGAASVDVGRTALRFVVDRGSIEPDGLTVRTVDGDERRVAWSDLAVVVVRRLPPDPPFSKLLLVDFATTSGPPVRILPASRLDWRQLPGGAAPTARDNVRKLIALARVKHRGLTVETGSEAFADSGGEPPIFGSMRQFAEYDARYGT